MADDASPIAPAAAISKPLAFTSDDFERMAKAGVFRDKRVELWDGVVVEMSPTLRPHSRARRRLANFLEAAAAALGLEADDEISVRYEGFYPQPDIVVYAPFLERRAIAPCEARLIVEVSDATLDEDLGPKRALYEKHGVPEYWVVDVNARQIHRFALEGAAFVATDPIPFGAVVESLTIPGLSVDTSPLTPL